MEPEPEAEAASYLSWPAPTTPFVLCNHRGADGGYTHGDGEIGRVQRASYRPQCCDCGMETVALAEEFAPANIGELLQACNRTESALRVRSCFNPECSGTSRRAWVDLRCAGDDAAGSGCRARSSAGDCALLPQVLAAPEGAEDNVLFCEIDAGEPMMKFDPLVLAVTAVACACELVAAVPLETLGILGRLSALVGADMQSTEECIRMLRKHVRLDRLSPAKQE